MGSFSFFTARARLALAVLVALTGIACGSEVYIETDDDGGGAGAGAGGSVISAADKLDLVLVVDNSRGMADKQEILQRSIPDLVARFTNPPCIDATTGVPADAQPSGPLEDCPQPGTVRSFAPVTDMHIAVITSSLGSVGADNCAGFLPGDNDDGSPITRSSDGGTVPTYSNKGFLVWDPDTASPSHTPQGETDPAALVESLGSLVTGAGEVGCGFEMPMEAWYRFLVDPNPYETITIENDVRAVLVGTDTALLAQRRDFLRPDSALAILMLSDENDCSTRVGGQFHFSLLTYNPSMPAQLYHLPKPRSECAFDPNDPCCLSCGQPQGDCPVDPTCDDDSNGQPDPLAEIDDAINLRCFDQKRRFGIDFLYPVQRYVDALTETVIQDRNGNVVPNPLFQDLDPDDAVTSVRGPGLVFLGAVTGVPWQDIARRDPNGSPNLISGGPQETGGFQSPDEMAINGTWNIILGDPSCYGSDPSCLPTDPLMISSTDARSGIQPATGDPVATSSNPLGNSVNGHDYSIPDKDDLQYACIFDLPAPRDCSSAGATEYCECKSGDTGDNPLCLDTVNFGYTQTQFRAKAYPTPRQLELLKAMGNRAVVGSACPEQLTDPTLPNFGYLPTVLGLIERLTPVFAQ